jgi:hypothetical protein
MPLRFTAVVVLLTLLAAGSVSALEKSVAPAPTARGDGWRSTTTCTVAYYNTCTGWIWCWSGWSPNDVIGVCFDCTCLEPGLAATLLSHALYWCAGSPPGRGYTGTLDVWGADANFCPTGAPLASQAFLPNAGWSSMAFGIEVTCPFIIACTFARGVGNPACIATDRPAAGPTGPQACGTCYQVNRLTRSFYYGTATTPFCPGQTFDDGVCNAELMWEAVLGPSSFVGVDDNIRSRTWSRVKSLYR